MEYLLFAAYLVLFAWLVTRTGFFNCSGLSKPQLVIIFLLKVMAGIFYGWVGIYYGTHAQMVDTWSFHYISIKETQLLYHHPREYFFSLFRNPYENGVSNFLGTKNSYWNDLKVNFFIKILSLFNIFSFGNYYTNVIFYSFISMFGPVAIYRVMNDVYPGKKTEILIAAFLIPSFLYWTSGLHKEGIIFLGLSLVVYNFYYGFKKKRFSLKNILLIVFGLLLILALRNFLIFIVVPALIAWSLAYRIGRRPLLIFSACYLVFLAFFFTAKYINEKFDFPKAVVVKQKEFTDLLGNSSVPMERLKPGFWSFFVNTPQAISLSMLRPYFTDVNNLLSLTAAGEIDCLLLLFLLSLIWKRKDDNYHPPLPFIYFCLFLSISLLIIIGYTVNNLGAIVRYRSIVLPFVLTPVLCGINWRKIRAAVNIINNKNVM